MPFEGIERTTYLEAKFGSLEAFGQLEEQVIAAGVEERILFTFEKIQRTPNTFGAHRVIWRAAQRGKQNEVVEALFRGYFLEGTDIGDVKALTHVAAEAGLDRTETEAFLASEEGVVEVKAEEIVGHRLGIRAVPYFVMNGTYALSGAQLPERFVTALKKVEADSLARKAGA